MKLFPQPRRIYERLKATPDAPVPIAELVALLGETKPCYICRPITRLKAEISIIRAQLPPTETIARCGETHYRLFIAPKGEPPHGPPIPF